MSFTAPEQLDRADRRLLYAWCGLLVFGTTLAGLFLVPAQIRNRRAADERHRARFDPKATEPGTTAADFVEPPGFNPVKVTVGIYVERIAGLSVRDATWTVDFQLWFRWSGDGIDPGAGFTVVDGQIESTEKLVELSAGGERYERYRVVAQITKPFDISRFPCDDHLLTINIENLKYLRSGLLFVPDMEASGVSSRVSVSAYTIYRKAAVEKPHSYATTLGDIRLAPGTKSTYSQFKYGLWIRRTGPGFYLKMFLSLYVAVAIAMLALLIKPTDVDPRFGLGVGGLFAAVANSYISSSLIPDTGVFTLADLVNFLGIAAILSTIMQSTLSLYLYERRGKQALSRRLDIASLACLLIGYTALNILLPWAASN